jgi:hypothetical protein
MVLPSYIVSTDLLVSAGQIDLLLTAAGEDTNRINHTFLQARLSATGTASNYLISPRFLEAMNVFSLGGCSSNLTSDALYRQYDSSRTSPRVPIPSNCNNSLFSPANIMLLDTAQENSIGIGTRFPLRGSVPTGGVWISSNFASAMRVQVGSPLVLDIDGAVVFSSLLLNAVGNSTRYTRLLLLVNVAGIYNSNGGKIPEDWSDIVMMELVRCLPIFILSLLPSAECEARELLGADRHIQATFMTWVADGRMRPGTPPQYVSAVAALRLPDAAKQVRCPCMVQMIAVSKTVRRAFIVFV